MCDYFVKQLVTVIDILTTNYITIFNLTNILPLITNLILLVVTVKAGYHELSCDLLYSRRCG